MRKTLTSLSLLWRLSRLHHTLHLPSIELLKAIQISSCSQQPTSTWRSNFCIWSKDWKCLNVHWLTWSMPCMVVWIIQIGLKSNWSQQQTSKWKSNFSIWVKNGKGEILIIHRCRACCIPLVDTSVDYNSLLFTPSESIVPQAKQKLHFHGK